MPFINTRIGSLANLARDLVNDQGIQMRLAIHTVATEHGVNARDIAKELNRRAQFKISKRRKVMQDEKDFLEEISRIEKARQRGYALAHEAMLQRSFRLAGHMDDY